MRQPIQRKQPLEDPDAKPMNDDQVEEEENFIVTKPKKKPEAIIIGFDGAANNVQAKNLFSNRPNLAQKRPNSSHHNLDSS